MNKQSKADVSDSENSAVSSETSRKIQFITSSKCATGACVGVARLEDGLVAVQDTKDFTRQPLSFTKDEWRAFVAGVKNGEFDV